MVYKWVNNSLNRLLPPRCLCCQQAGQQLCPDCEVELPKLGTRCQRCALPLPQSDRLCRHCLRRPPRFTRCLSAFSYRPPVDQLLLSYKHAGHMANGRVLAQLWMSCCGDDVRREPPDALIPIPLHWRRRWQRRFNQSRLLAEQWGDAFGLVVTDALQRRVHTAAQQGLTAAERRRNLRRAFVLSPRANVTGKHLALVDDVLTTGATANAAAVILLDAGARRVDIWCLARTPDPGQ
ncbi:ComF family protein [Spongiibacter tropicus]|uniref:ComF family protein n=1 Tax=Spongiibacter tropicus TaxID=454602 RepID=UPI0035BE2A09